MVERMTGWMRRLGPVRSAFLVSLLLSLSAVQGHLINRDGIYYLETAQAILEKGLLAGLKTGEWAFLPVLIAALSYGTTLAPQHAAHVLDAVLMAGACSLLVAITRRRQPEAAWAACLVVLAIPAFNQYRSEILREYGFWFFSMLGFWLAMRWEAAPRWREALACQMAFGIAALFRLEAVVFYPALMLWQAFAAPAGQRLRRALTMGCVALAAGLVVAALVTAGALSLPGRVLYYLDAANPLRAAHILGEAAGRMQETVFPYKYSREEAAYILFFGLLSMIPVKFVKMSGVFVVPLVYAFVTGGAKAVLRRWQPLSWAFLGYVLVLVAFVTHQFFLVGRYVSMLNLLAVPVVACGLALLMRRYPRWRTPMVALALVTMVANVVSLSPKKTHIVEAGRWLGANVTDARRVGVDNARLAYYAGWRAAQTVGLERAAMARALAERRIDMVAVEAPRKDADVEKWLADQGLRTVRRFANAAGDAVIIAVPAQDNASTAARSRPNAASTE